MTWDELDTDLAATPGTVSVYVGRPGIRPAYTRLPESPHYAASTMKVAVLAALYRAAEAGTIDLDAPVPVVNDFPSAKPGGGRFSCDAEDDNDDAVWARLGGTATLRWLAERMIIRSSNLATNLVLGHVGLPTVAAVWADSGARHSRTARGIEDFAARDAGLDNQVTAADLAGLFCAITRSRLAQPGTCSAMLDVLFRQERGEDLAAGLPAGVRIAHKNGWVRGVRHGAGMVFPDDAPPYAIVVCTSAAAGSAGDDEAACRLIARISAMAWEARHRLGGTR
ncbi:serine hydrolase [Micromonospora sp. HM5-17]|jgi:beta-lactamase class A|uniref:serine hydrolase n=1 Tax=Micromonospora sp. HM5-17 TaxID=2487710 RepID=UPI000F472765|nr:serine hydrolase [Micromonospora sp. HM5-17]ROT31089.1 serine hydrolase [Micromonospora sp. HM5-17]